jgi:hypothetical protein
MTCGAFVYNNEKNALDDYKLFASSLSSTTQEKKPQDNNELEGSLLFSTI